MLWRTAVSQLLKPTSSLLAAGLLDRQYHHDWSLAANYLDYFFLPGSGYPVVLPSHLRRGAVWIFICWILSGRNILAIFAGRCHRALALIYIVGMRICQRGSGCVVKPIWRHGSISDWVFRRDFKVLPPWRLRWSSSIDWKVPPAAGVVKAPKPLRPLSPPLVGY